VEELFSGIKVLNMADPVIGWVNIISSAEVPDERIGDIMASGDDAERMFKMFELVENCLVNPKDWERFETMTGSQFRNFVMRWIEQSGVLGYGG
jgi:hypothetical protein